MKEFRVWCENGDLCLVTSDYGDAVIELMDLEKNCPCGEAECGVMSLHGYSIQVVEDGLDVTHA